MLNIGESYVCEDGEKKLLPANNNIVARQQKAQRREKKVAKQISLSLDPFSLA
jgi:hypothetical protein